MGKYGDERLRQVFERTSGKCHICGKSLRFEDYGRSARDGGWQVEHSRPVAKGGTDHLNNLCPACVPCNLTKGTRSATAARAAHGRKRKPLSVEQRRKAQAEQAKKGLTIGAIAGLLIDPTGVASVLGGALGAHIGKNVDPDD